MRDDLGAWELVARLGWTVVLSVAGSLLLGLWVDSVLNTRPFGTLFFVFVGSLVAIVGIYRQATAAMNEAARRRQRDSEEKPPETRREE